MNAAYGMSRPSDDDDWPGCEACDEDPMTIHLCDGCGCCQGCCNCTETDCDCGACLERREEEDG